MDKQMAQHYDGKVKDWFSIFIVVILAFFPFALLVSFFLKSPGVFKVIKTPYVISVVKFTFFQAILSAVLSIFIGLPGAYLLSRTRIPLRSLFRSLSMVPFVVPGIVMALGMVGILGRKGILNLILSIFGFKPRSFLYSFWSIILAHVIYNFPVTIRVVGDAWERIDEDTVNSAMLEGYGRFGAFLRIDLPLLFPSILFSFLLSFSYCFTSFSVVMIIGGVRFSTMEVLIYSNLRSFLNLDVALSLTIFQSMILGMVSLITFKLGGFILEEPTKVSRGEKIPRWALFYSIPMIVFGFSPIISSILLGFVEHGGMGLSNFMAFFSHDSPALENLTKALGFTLFYSTSASLFTLFISFMAGYSGKLIHRFLANMLVGISPVTLAYGYSILGKMMNMDINSMHILLIPIYTVITYPIALTIMTSTWRYFPKQLLEMAEMDGADKFQKFFHVILPNMKREMISSFLLCSAVSMGELAATLTLQSPDFLTISTLIYRMYSSRHFQEAKVLNTILSAMIIAMFILGEYISKSDEE